MLFRSILFRPTLPTGLMGFMISFLGSLPVGAINLLVVEVQVKWDIWAAVQCSLGAVCVEMSVIRFALYSTSRLHISPKILLALRWIAMLLMLTIGIGNLVLAFQQQGPVSTDSGHSLLLSTIASPFILGAFVRLLIPTFIPYWLGWNALLKSKGLDPSTSTDHNQYVAGIGLGTFMAHIVYIIGGVILADLLASNQAVLHGFVGILLVAISCYQIIQLRNRP